MTEDDVTRLARVLGRACKRRGVDVVTAESCTGGGGATAITRISGSAKWFERGFVTYTNIAKKEMLGVSEETLKAHGAVSEEVAREMAAGALKHSHADVSVAVTGIAGPTGGVPGKPVGTVHFAWGVRDGRDPDAHVPLQGRPRRSTPAVGRRGVAGAHRPAALNFQGA